MSHKLPEAIWASGNPCKLDQEALANESMNSVYRLKPLEAPVALLSHIAMLVAIVSQNSFVLKHVFVGYRTILERDVAKLGIAWMCPSETKHVFVGVSHSSRARRCKIGYRMDVPV